MALAALFAQSTLVPAPFARLDMVSTSTPPPEQGHAQTVHWSTALEQLLASHALLEQVAVCALFVNKTLEIALSARPSSDLTAQVLALLALATHSAMAKKLANHALLELAAWDVSLVRWTMASVCLACPLMDLI